MKPADALDVVARVAPPEALDFETIDAAIDSLLGADPPPHVFACDELGFLVPFPPEIRIAPEQVISGIALAMELCLPGELAHVVKAWEHARARRAAQTSIHLRSDPARCVTIHLVDARHRFGTYLGILVGTHGSFENTSAKPSLFRPRVCSMERDEVSVICGIDAATTQILGWSAQEMIGSRTLDLVHPEDRTLAIANWMEMLGRPGFQQRVLLRYRHRDGKYIWFEVTHRNLLNDPALGRVLTEMVDVSERMNAIEALRASEQLLRRLTEALPLGIVQVDAARRIVYRNELLLEILGVPEAETLDEQFSVVARRDHAALGAALTAVLGRGEAAEVELTVDYPSGARRCKFIMRALGTESGTITGAIVCVTDVTEGVRLREQLERRVKYDDLTHCHNRSSILEALENALQQPRRIVNGLAVVFVDLDRFKDVNDRYGHAAGDELLRLMGERLLAIVRAGDIVGRLGGDEFLIVCPDVATPEKALEIGHRIAASLSQDAVLGAVPIVTGSSVGIAWTDRAIGCDAIVAVADKAMYESKRAARGPVLALP